MSFADRNRTPTPASGCFYVFKAGTVGLTMKMTRNRRKRLGLPLLISACLSFASYTGSEAETEVTNRGNAKTFQLQSSSDTRPVKVLFGDLIYNIPRNYLVGVDEARLPNTLTAFTLYLLLPDLKPRTQSNAAEFDRTGWHDQLRALVQFGKVPRAKEEVLRFYLEIRKKSESDFRVVEGRYRLYEFPNTLPSEIYTADTPNGLFLFTCHKKTDFKTIVTPACTVMEDIGHNVGLTYSFSRTHLAEALDIDARLRSLIASFSQK